MLPDDLAARLRHEARRRDVSVAEIVREAVESYLPARTAGERLSFFAIGEGAPPDASEHVDEYVRNAVRRDLSS
jgi:hypothetical protein